MVSWDMLPDRVFALAASLMLREEVVVPFSGRSMIPTLHPGDRVVVRRCRPKDVAVNDVLVVATELGLVIHRVIGLRDTASGRLFTFRGDGMPCVDLTDIPECYILGRAIGRLSPNGEVTLSLQLQPELPLPPRRWLRWARSALLRRIGPALVHLGLRPLRSR
jgi:hypothetical protein